jgi:hypothetical protein
MDKNMRQTLESNKREMFDAMRAYHASEISHANHAITIILSVAGAANAAAIAILFGDHPTQTPVAIAASLSGIVLPLVLVVALTTHLKIDGDHSQYAAHGREYVATCDALGLFEDLSANQRAIKTNRDIGQGKGYRKTQGIVWAFAGLVSAMTLTFSILIGDRFASVQCPKPPSASPTAAIDAASATDIRSRSKATAAHEDAGKRPAKKPHG